MTTASMPRTESLGLAFERFSEAARLLEEQQRALQERLAALDLELASRNNELHNVLENLADGVLAADLKGRITTANSAACALLGRSLEELIGQPVGQVLAQHLGTDFAARKVAEGFQFAETRDVALPQAAAHLRLHITPARDVRTQAPIGGMVILEDITALMHWRERALLNERLSTMGQVAAQVAHEIRNPLGSVELLASMLAQEAGGNGRTSEIAQHIVGAVQSLDALVSNILLFARGREPEVAATLWEDVAQQALHQTQHALSQAGVSVECRWQARPVPVLGDADLLMQAVVNLVINASQALAEQARPRVLALETGTSPAGAWIRIVDNGPGVPADLRARIFDPFVTTRRRGTGLGLAIVSHIVAAHGGQVRCGEAEGGGAIFEITLPRAEGVQTSAASNREGTHG